MKKLIRIKWENVVLILCSILQVVALKDLIEVKEYFTLIEFIVLIIVISLIAPLGFIAFKTLRICIKEELL